MKPACKLQKKSFTLIELLTIIAIIVILAGIVVAGVSVAQRKASRAKAQTEIAKFEVAVQRYREEYGYYPQDDGSDIIVTRNFLEDIASPAGRPYLNLEELNFSNGNWIDPFGGYYRYNESNPEHNTSSYDVWSRGNDANSTADDIGNFKAD